jgi:hypothetical protein
MNRRKFLAAMAAGAVVTAEGLWIPGQKLISIPKSLNFDYDIVWGDGTTSYIRWTAFWDPKTTLLIPRRSTTSHV